MNRRSLIAGLAALPIAAATAALGREGDAGALPKGGYVTGEPPFILARGEVVIPRHEVVEFRAKAGVTTEHDKLKVAITQCNTTEVTAQMMDFAKTARPGDTLTVVMDCLGEQRVIGTLAA